MGTQNIAAAADAQGRQAFGGREKIIIDPYFFRRLDKRFDAINDVGMIASPTFLWAAEWHPSGKVLDPGAWLSDEQAIVLGRYFTARYGAHQVVWLFAGDHDCGPKAERWRHLGRAIFGERPNRLVSMHPAPKHLHERSGCDLQCWPYWHRWPCPSVAATQRLARRNSSRRHSRSEHRATNVRGSRFRSVKRL